MEKKFQVETFHDSSDSRFSRRKSDNRWERMKKADYAELEKFEALTFASFNMIDELIPENINRELVEEMMVVLTSKNPPFLNQKNPAALILAYSCIRDGVINMDRLSYLHINAGLPMKISRPDSDKIIFTPIKRIDLVRYARYWLSLLSK